MGYFLTNAADNAPPANSHATPKTHTPGPQVQERGLRYHSPSLGRWINRDPIGEWGGINVYVIGLNTVINTFDILGLKATTEACCCAGKKFDFGKKCCLKSQECKGKVCRIRIYIGHSGDNMKAKLKSQDGLGGADRVAAVSCMQQTMNALIPSDQS
jgi:RHS repeat-associated protein